MVAAAVPDRNLLSDGINELLRVTREHLAMDVACVGEFRGGKRVFTYVSQSGTEEGVFVGGSDPLEETYCEKVVTGRITGVIPDASATPDVSDMRLTEELGIGAYLGTPIVLSSGRIYGTLCCFSRDARPALGQAELDVLRLMARLIAQRLELEGDGPEAHLVALARIQECLEGDQPTILYQPIVALDTGRIVGVEALARFASDPQRPPEAWFLEAHRVGFGVELEVKAVTAALAGLEHLPEHFYVSINVGVETLCAEALKKALDAAPGHRLVLELTEHEAVKDPCRLRAVLEGYRARGVRLAVDDMGAGYSGLAQLLDLAPDIIKMDHALTRDVDVDPARRSLARATVEFAASVGAQVVAEGVQTERELEALQELGMSAAQGYFLGRPARSPWDVVDLRQRLIWPRQSQFAFTLVRDAVGVLAVGLFGYVASSALDGSERIQVLHERFEVWQVDEIPIGLSVMALALTAMGLVRGKQLLREVARRREAELQLGRANADLWRRRLSEERRAPPAPLASLGQHAETGTGTLSPAPSANGSRPAGGGSRRRRKPSPPADLISRTRDGAVE